MVDPFGGSFTGVSASSLSSASSSPSSVSVPHVWNRRFSACPVQLSSTAAATATSSTVLPSVLHGDGDQWWTARYVRTIMHETLHILGFSPPLLTEYAVNVTHRGEDVVVISEAGPVRAARAFLACPTLDGVELEDEGGDGTALGHWERLWLRDDIMSGIPSSVSALSSITLSFLDSLPFYRVSLDYAEPMPWGAAAGCGFLDERCKPLSSPASIVRLATSRVVSNDSRPSSEPSAMSAEASPRTRRAPKALVDEGGEGTPSNSSTFTTPTPQSASTPSTTTSTTVAPTSTTTATVPATSSTTTSTTTTTAKPTTTSTTTEVPSTTTTTTTTTTTSTTSTTPTPTTTSTTTTSTTSEAPSTSTTSTTTSASPVTVPPSPATRESRQDLLARAKYWCTDKGLTSRRVPQCTYDRRSIGICNVDFRPIKGEKIGGPRSGTTQGSPIDAQTTTTTTTTEPSEEADDSSSRDGDDDGGSEDSAHANTTSVAGAVNGTTAGTRKRPRLTGRSLLMNGCPVVEPYLNRWCTNGLLSIDLAPDAEQDVLLRSQGYYFGSQSRCAAVADFKPVTRPPVAAGEENANITVGANTSSESDIGLEAPYAQATETKDDLMNATDARCLHMRCVPKDTASAGGEDHGASTALFSAGRYRVEIEVGGFWLACPMDGRSGHITVPAETGFSGMLACDDAELLCTAELVQEPDDGVSHTQRGVATLSGTTALATASSWLPEYLVPVELLVSVTTSTKLNLASHSTDRSKSSAKKSTKNSAKKGKKQNHPSVVSAQAEMDDDSNNTALVLSAWRLTAEQCPAALRMAVQRDLDELLASASAVRQAQGLPAYTPLGTLVRQREGAMRVLPLFTASVWSGRGTAEPPSSSTRAQRKAARSERTANKSDGEKNSGVPPVLLQLGLRLAVTTAHRLALVDYIHDVTSLAWRANSSLPRVEALLMTSYQTLSTGGRRHAACAASWEVPLPGVFGDILALAEPSPDAAVLAASLWADAQPTVPGVARAMPLDGPMVPPGDVFAVAQVELQLMALLPPRRMRAAMLSHPLVLEALRHDVSALLGVTQNLVSVQNIVWAPEATATQKRSLTGESLDSARALWQTVRAFVRGGGGGASAVTTLPAGEQTIGTITALVHAHPIPDTLTFSGAVGSAKSVRGGEDNAVAHLSPDVTLYTRQYWTRVLRATVAERVPLRYTGEALSELMYGAAPSGISFLFPSVLDTKARAGKGEADVNNDDLTTLGAYDELEMFRQQSQGKQRGRGTSKTSSADPTVALREKLMTMRPALSTGTVWVGSVLRLSDGEPSVLPSTCHASMADALLERSSTVSLVSLLTPSFLRWEPSCRRWRVHGGMSWCLSVYEGRTCAEANTVDDAVRSFCTNIRTVWFMLATVSAAILLWWMYGITRCCCRLCCCRASAEVEAEDEW